MFKAFIGIAIIFCTLWPVNVIGETPRIEVIYPKECSSLGAVDSSFIFGSVKNTTQLLINDVAVPIHKDGGFLAFLPMEPGQFFFDLTAFNETDTVIHRLSVCVPQPKKSFNYRRLRIKDWNESSAEKIVLEGDLLKVNFQATPGCIAWFSIPGIIDSVPMAEMPPRIQPYWGESVFGAGTVPDSMKIKGYYSGYLKVDNQRLTDSSRIYYHLSGPTMSLIYKKMFAKPIYEFDFSLMALLSFHNEVYTDSSKYFVKVNPDEYPCLVELTDSVQIMRVGPGKGYLSSFQPRGVKAFAVGKDKGWLKLRLTPTQVGWVKSGSVRFLEPERPPIVSYLRSIRSYFSTDKLTVEFPLSERHPYRVEEEDKYTLRIYLYGVISDTDWIRYDFSDKNLEIATWSQPEPELYCLKLKFKKPIWGYDTFYESNTLKLQINKPPKNIKRLKNKVIVIDPGHSADAGAIGPTGLKESEANLLIALALEKELRNKGATVVLTRADMSHMPLYDRPQIAGEVEADLFISIHNNALPDGVNPFVNNGTSSYYYHPHSIELARSIQTELLKKLKLPDYGLYYGNLAVNRPTQYPAVLIECAFMMLPEQEALLKTKKFHKKIAQAIRKGIERFLKDYDDR